MDRPAELRPWRDEDVDGWIRLRLEIDSILDEPVLRRLAAGGLITHLRRTVAERDGVAIGYGLLGHFAGDPDLGCAVLVDKAHRGTGVASALFADLTTVPTTLPWISTFPVDDRSIAVAQRWGFTRLRSSLRSQCVLDPVPSRPRVPDGLTTVDLTLPEAEARSLVPAVEDLLRVGQTNPEAAQQGEYETWASIGGRFPDSIIALVLDGERALAMSVVDPGPNGSWLIIYSCVAPDVRRRGLGRLVKQVLHASAAERGARTLVTENADDNPEMRALNASLGYVVVGERVHMGRPAPGLVPSQAEHAGHALLERSQAVTGDQARGVDVVG
jgi:GNAT superfamily N-acetyltransferase